MTQVFISYTKKDKPQAFRLYDDLKSAGAGIVPWLDERSLLPGENWKISISRAIRESHYFLALISAHSVAKRGFVQKEIRDALEIQKEIPESEIYLIPVLLDDSKPSFEALRELHWIDMVESWSSGFYKLLKVLIRASPTIDDAVASEEELAIFQAAFLWHGKVPPTVQDHWFAMTPQIAFTKQRLHDAVETGKLTASLEIRSQKGLMRFVSRSELRRFAEAIGEVPSFLES